MRAVLLLLIASCGTRHVAAPSARPVGSETERTLMSVAAGLRRGLPKTCHHTCCADIPSHPAISARNPRQSVPRDAPRHVALRASDPLVRALAVTRVPSADAHAGIRP